MKLKTINDYDLKGKTVLLRVDMNSPVEKGKVIFNERIEEAARSIAAVMAKGAKVVVLAHQGRKGDDDFTNLKQHAKFLNKFVKIKFVDDILGEKAEKAIKKLKDGEAILLDNVRSLTEETQKEGENAFVDKLSKLADFYVNDAFSVSHREQASVTGFPKVMKSCFGILIEKELNALEKIKLNDVVYILGGSKAEENMLFLQKGKKILACGKFGQVCMLANGFKFGKHEEFLEKEIIPELKEKIAGLDITTPVDFAVKEKNKRKEIPLSDFPNEYEIFDIGEKSIEIFRAEIMKAKAIFMKGPAGYIEDKKFQKGTKEILQAVIDSKAFSVLGGGHLSTAIEELGIDKSKINHISLSGGALANYVAGQKLPGIEVVMNSKL